MMAVRSFLVALLASSCVFALNPTPSIDLFNVPGDNPFYVPVTIGYPPQGPFNMAVYLNRDVSWVFSADATEEKHAGHRREKRESVRPNHERCFDPRESETFGDMKNETFGKAGFAVDVLNIDNEDYEFQFGLAGGRCDSRGRRPRGYAGVLALAPTKELRPLRNFLKQLDYQTVSFFLPSARSQQQRRALVFGELSHPACISSENKRGSTLSVSETEWRFAINCCRINPTNNTATEAKAPVKEAWNLATFSTDVKEIYGPAEMVFALYKQMKAKRLTRDGPYYYVPCDQLPAVSFAFKLQNDGYYTIESRHLVTPDAKDKNKCVLRMITGGLAMNRWVFGKKFMERFCVTLNYRTREISLGTVVDADDYDRGMFGKED